MFSKWCFFKRFIVVCLIWCIFSIAFFGCILTPFYRVKEFYGIVSTQFDGKRWADKSVGIHSRAKEWNPLKWVKSAEEYSLRTEYIYLDDNLNPHEMQAADKIKFQGAGVWTYRIENLEKFGIQMGDRALQMLTAELNGIAKEKIQAKDVEFIVTRIGDINREINECRDIKNIENKYGVTIESFRLTHATYPSEMNQGTADAKRIKIMAEAAKEAAKNIKEARVIRAEADKIQLEKLIEGSGVQSEEGRKKALETLRNLDFYEMLKERSSHETIYVVPHGETPNLTLPDPTQKGKRENDDKLMQGIIDILERLSRIEKTKQNTSGGI